MNATISPGLRCGTSGLLLPVPNKKAFPEAFRGGSRLTYYASLFNSIEVNSSFYRIPKPGTFTRWSGEVPADFEFTVKLWRGITHATDLGFILADVTRYMDAIRGLGEKKGCLLIQLPPALNAAAAGKLERLLDRIVREDPDRAWNLAVEFRHRSWYTDEVDAMLAAANACRVLHDMPSSGVSLPPPRHAAVAFVYLRLHGPDGRYKGRYSRPVLLAWAERISGWLTLGKAVYVYFNNTIGGDALADLSYLRTLIPVAQQPS